MPRLIHALAGVAAGLTLPAALAAEPPEGSVAIINAVIFDGSGAEPFPGGVVIVDGRIAEVLTDGAPQAETVIDAGGAALLPGLFDVHTHWSPSGSPSDAPDIANAYLSAGVTTINDFHQPPEAYAPRRAWLEELAAPHVLFASRMSTRGGHGADWADINTTRWVDTPQAARAAVDEVAAYGPDLIKVFADGWRYGLNPDRTTIDEETLAAVVDAAAGRDLQVVTHTVTVQRAAMAARAGVSMIVHSVQDRPLDEAAVQTLLEHGTAYAPTLAVYEPVKPWLDPPQDMDSPRMRLTRAKFDFALENLRTLSEAGAPIALGTDAGIAGVPHGEAVHRELELMVQAGLTPSQALIAGTATSARAMRLDEDRGTIQAGRRADIILIGGRPWEDISDIRNVARVWVDGVSVIGPDAAPPAANTRPTLPAQTVGALIDDFESEDGRTRLDTLRVDDFDGGADRTVQIAQRLPREDGEDHALGVTARMSVKDSPHAGVVFPLTRGGTAPADVRAYDGIEFDLRGDGEDYEVRLHTVNGPWIAAAPSATEWNRIRIPFSDFAPDGHEGAWTGADVIDIRFRLRRPGGETAWMMLDNLSLYPAER